MSLPTAIGYFAGFLTTTALIPQLIKTWKTKSTRDISLGMFVTLCSGIFCWLIYGFLIDEEPVILWNAITLLLALSILGMKLKYNN